MVGEAGKKQSEDMSYQVRFCDAFAELQRFVKSLAFQYNVDALELLAELKRLIQRRGLKVFLETLMVH